MAVWKVSYVIRGSAKVGGIINLNHAPEPGEYQDWKRPARSSGNLSN